MKQIINKIQILTIVPILAIGAISACNLAEKNIAENKGAARENTQSSPGSNAASAENTLAENKTSNENTPKANSDGLPELTKGENYKTSVRKKMLQAGWKTARSLNADWCGSAETTCDEFEEYESKTEKGLTNFRWKKGNKFVEISCSEGNFYAFESYTVEKNSMTIAQTERWNEFWKEFKSALAKKDKAALKTLMTEKLDGGGDVETSEQRIAAIEESNMWSSMQKTAAEGTTLGKCDKPCRISKDNYLVFTYDMADWKWSGLGGEGGE